MWRKLFKTIMVAMGAGAGGAVIDAVSHGQLNPKSLLTAAIIGAVSGVSGLWMEKPKDAPKTQP